MTEEPIQVPTSEDYPTLEDLILDAYHQGYRQGQADEHARWNEALKTLVENRTNTRPTWPEKRCSCGVRADWTPCWRCGCEGAAHHPGCPFK